MNIRNCKNCGKIFNYVIGEPICPDCRGALEAKFQQVKEYLRDNRGANIQNVADECEVETGLIKKWLREGRLEMTENSAIMLQCEGCGANIRSGRFCNKCMMNLNQNVQAIRQANAPQKTSDGKKPSVKMHYLD